MVQVPEHKFSILRLVNREHVVQSLVFHYNRNVTGTSAFGALALVEVVLEASYCYAKTIENLRYIAEYATSTGGEDVNLSKNLELQSPF